MVEAQIDVAVVGGGRAGLAAAIAAAEAGAPTLQVTELPLEAAGSEPKTGLTAAVADLVRHAIEAGVDLRTRSTVWGLFAGNVLGIVGPDGAWKITARRIVLATGARTVSEPAPGWSEPDIQLALMAECAAGYSASLGGWVPGRSEDMVTSNPAVLVAGDCAGLGPLPTADAEGRLAGLRAAFDLGHGSEEALTGARSHLAHLAPDRMTEAAALAAWYVQGHQARAIEADAFVPPTGPLAREAPTGGAPALAASSMAGTHVCPCEGVTEADILAAISAGARSLTDVKRRTRAGMGGCQGMLCGRPIAHLIARRTGLPLGEIPPMTARPPVRLTGLGSLAGNRGAGSSGSKDAGVHSG